MRYNGLSYGVELSLKISNQRGRRDGSIAKCTCCSRGLPRFTFQHPHGGSQESGTPVLGNLIPSSDFLGHQACMWHTHIHAGKILIK